MNMSYLESGSLVSIKNSSSNIDPITGGRSNAKIGIITRMDKTNIYYLPIFEEKYTNDIIGKFLNINGLQCEKYSNFNITGFIDLESEYITSESLTLIGKITNNEQIYEILKKFENYQTNKAIYASVLDIKKVK